MIKLRSAVLLALVTALLGVLGACGSESPEPTSRAQQEQAPESADPKVEIMTPETGAKVPQKQQVTGTAAGISDDQEMWIFTRKRTTMAPQSTAITVGKDGTWSQTAYVGRDDGTDAGDEFEITIQLVPKAAGQSIVDYLKEAAKTGKYPGFDPPAGSVEAAKIAVVKAKN